MTETDTADRFQIRLTAPAGRTPLGAVFAAAAGLAVLAAGALRLDHLPWSLCYFKAVTGYPCPTCGTTRAFARLFWRDLPGALAMNPLATVGLLVLALWGLADLALLARGRALSLELSPGAGRVARFLAVGLLLANWAYLVAAGR
jgi:uncharacterized protein DUF2752